MEAGSIRIKAGAIEFALSYRDLDGGLVGSPSADQGVCIQVVSEMDGKETELLRFDCLDVLPHYHYGPEKKNEVQQMDLTTAGNPVGWTIRQLRERLPEMLKRAGYEELAGQLDARVVAKKLDKVESTAREMAVKDRHNVTHKRGDLVIEAGAIRVRPGIQEGRG